MTPGLMIDLEKLGDIYRNKSGNYIHILVKSVDIDTLATLDGDFSLEDVEAIAIIMKEAKR